MSREGAAANKPKPPAAGTPIWVWVVYALGLLAGVIIVFSLLFTFGALALSGDVPVGYDFSWLAAILWGGLALAGLVTWIVRRRQR